MFDPLMFALSGGGSDKTPGIMILQGDTLLARPGNYVPYDECCFIPPATKDMLGQVEKIRENVYKYAGIVQAVPVFDATFAVYMRSLGLWVNQKATTCIRGDGIFLVGATFSLPYNGQTMVFYLEMQIPTTGEITGDNVFFCLSIVGGGT